MATAKSITVDAATLKDVENKIEAMGVKYMVASYVDMHGIPKAKIVPVNCLDHDIKIDYR